MQTVRIWSSEAILGTWGMSNKICTQSRLAATSSLGQRGGRWQETDQKNCWSVAQCHPRMSYQKWAARQFHPPDLEIKMYTYPSCWENSILGWCSGCLGPPPVGRGSVGEWELWTWWSWWPCSPWQPTWCSQNHLHAGFEPRMCIKLARLCWYGNSSA